MKYQAVIASDGTQKLDFSEGYTAVIIPTKDEKYAVCVSCQIGCPVGCSFCYTGKMKLKRNLSAEEIYEQVSIAASIINKTPTTVVFMGMGEPTLNLGNVLSAADMIHTKLYLSYNHITISTSCLSNIKSLLDIPYNVALSIHSPFDSVRKKLMPPSIGISDILMFAKEYCMRHPKKELMIEYALMDGVNDRDEDLKELLSLPWPKRTLFNYIQYNDLDAFKRSPAERLQHFKQATMAAGFKSFVRLSRGNDIKAACGMLDQPNVSILKS